MHYVCLMLTYNMQFVVKSCINLCGTLTQNAINVNLMHLRSFYRTQVSLGSDLWVLMSLTEGGFADLTDVTLADEDSNSIPTDDVNGQSQAI